MAKRAPKAKAEHSISVVGIGTLTPDPANLRRRDDRAKGDLRASLKRFGPARSIVVDGKGIVRAGNGTLEAATAEGCTEVLLVKPAPGQLVAVQRDDWSPTEGVAYAVGDNQLALHATWDDAGLAETLRALQSEDFDLDAVGFTGEEIDALCEDLGKSIVGDEWSDAADGIPDGDKSPFQSMTFTLSDEQAATVNDAIDAAKAKGAFTCTGNENSNGNALARIVETYLGRG